MKTVYTSIFIPFLKRSLLITSIIFGCSTILYSQTDSTDPFKGVPFVSREEYEPPFYDMAKRLWLPDSIVAKEGNTTHKKEFDKKNFETILSGITTTNISKRKEYFQKLSYYDDSIVFVIFSEALIHDSDNAIKSICIRKLGKKVTPVGVAALVVTTKSVSDLRQKIEIAKSLISVGKDSIGFQLIKSIYKIVNPVTQIDFLYYIRKIPIDETREFLFECQKNSNPYVAASASLVLAQLNESDSAFTYLSKLVDNPDRFVRIIALKGLTSIKGDRSINLIKQKKEDNDPKVKKIAIEIINELKQ